MPSRPPLLLVLLLSCVSIRSCALRLSPRYLLRRPSSMRARYGWAAMRADEEDAGFSLSSLFKLNRYTPEAQSNQLKWAREQMDLEVPEATADGDSIADREDFINKYMASERSKFGREIDRATAEAEVDEWLLKQATFAPAKTSGTDIALAVLVFVAAFGGQLYFASK